MKRAILDATNTVINIVELEDGLLWQPPDGTTIGPGIGDPNIGDVWDGQSYQPPTTQTTQ